MKKRQVKLKSDSGVSTLLMVTIPWITAICSKWKVKQNPYKREHVTAFSLIKSEECYRHCSILNLSKQDFAVQEAYTEEWPEATTSKPAWIIWWDMSSKKKKKEKKCRSSKHEWNPGWQVGGWDRYIRIEINKALWESRENVVVWGTYKLVWTQACLCTSVWRPEVSLQCLFPGTTHLIFLGLSN